MECPYGCGGGLGDVLRRELHRHVQTLRFRCPTCDRPVRVDRVLRASVDDSYEGNKVSKPISDLAQQHLITGLGGYEFKVHH